MRFSQFQLIQTNIQVELLIFEKWFLLIVKFNKVFNEIEEISWSDVIKLFSTFSQSFVELNDCVMNSNDSVDNYMMSGFILLDFDFKWLHNRINYHCKLFSNLNQTLLRPVSEPINNTTIEQGRRRSGSVWKIWIVRVHCEDNMQVSLDILNKWFVNFFVRWNTFRVAFLKLW